MADNYLEKKMDEHRRAISSPMVKRRVSPIGTPRGTVSLKIESLRILVTSCVAPYVPAIVKRLCDAGCRVAFVATDDQAGRRLAQSTGSRCYPAALASKAMADLTAVWGGVDVLVITDRKQLTEDDLASVGRVILVDDNICMPSLPYNEDVKINVVSADERTPEEIAYLSLLLCLSESSFIDRRVL